MNGKFVVNPQFDGATGRPREVDIKRPHGGLSNQGMSMGEKAIIGKGTSPPARGESRCGARTQQVTRKGDRVRLPVDAVPSHPLPGGPVITERVAEQHNEGALVTVRVTTHG